MDFMESVKTCLQKYIDFNGRASRSEYWWFVLLTILLSFIPVIGWILRLVLLLPSLAVQVRRLHDMERSAWWLLLLVPPITVIGVFVLLIMSIFPGTPGYNRYGPSPRQPQQGMGGYGYYQNPGDPYSPPPSTGSYTESHYDASLPDSLMEPDPSGRQFCTQCGIQLQPEARFCTECGTAVSS